MTSNNNNTNIALDPYDSAGGMWVGWVIYIVLLVPTLLFNLLTILIILSSPVLRKKVNPFMVFLLAVDDAFLSLFCLLSCASDYSVRQIYLGRTGCEMEAIFIVFFMLSTGYTLCFISYHNEQRVRNKPGLTIRKCCALNVIKWIWCAIITWLATDGFDTEARVMPSGVYCLVSLNNLLSGLLFFIPGIVVIGSFLIHRYKLLFNYIRDFGQRRNSGVSANGGNSSTITSSTRQVAPWSNTNTHSHSPSAPSHTSGLSEEQIHSRLKSARKMFLFVFWYIFCASPVLILALYETSGNDAWGGFHIMAGFCIHFNSLINPGLYFWSNRSALRYVPILKSCWLQENATKSGSTGEGGVAELSKMDYNNNNNANNSNYRPQNSIQLSQAPSSQLYSSVNRFD